MKTVIYILIFIPFISGLMSPQLDDKSEIWFYLDKSRKPTKFFDSIAEFQKGKLTFHLKIKDSITIQCQINSSDRCLGNGQYKLSKDTIKAYIQIESKKHPNDFKDSIIVRRVFKKHGNWIWHGPQMNIFYQYGKKLDHNELPVFIKEMNDFVYLDKPRTTLNLPKSTYIFEKSVSENELKVWKFLNNSSTWFYGVYKKFDNDKSISYKAYHYDYKINRSVIIDSIFNFPIYDISEKWKKMEK